MIEFLGSSFISNYVLLYDQRLVMAVEAKRKGAVDLTADEKNYIEHIADEFRQHCKAIGLQQSALQAWVITEHLERNCNYFVAANDLETLMTLTANELRVQRFAFIPPWRHRYFQQDNLFGLSTPAPFPSADKDIRDAGNALAVDLHTAAVFHLMRVAEIGLRAFARHLRVKLPKKKGPIEWAQWGEILREIQDKVDAIAAKSGTRPRKSADLAFYRGVLAEFQGFKDMYRNDVMHVRKTYNKHEAASAIEKVKGFMLRLSERVQE